MNCFETNAAGATPGPVSRSATPTGGWRGLLIVTALFASGLLAGATSPDPTRVQLAWNPSPDSSVVGYRVYYGTTSGQYTNSVTVGNVTTATITGLANGVTYYFATTAYTAADVQSPFSNEIHYPPAFSQLQLRMAPTRQMILTLAGQVGHQYAIEATPDFITWTVIGTVTPAANGIGEFTDANATNFSRRFYRLRDTTL